MKSLVRPKKITIIGSDGKKYPLMCKAKDELRKDGRLMDINRVCVIYPSLSWKTELVHLTFSA